MVSENRLGLASVTFRDMDAKSVAAAAADAKLGCVEWGGDVHVPAGNIVRALTVRAECGANGVDISSYGSYYCLGSENADSYMKSFAENLDCAVFLGAPVMRIWGGSKRPGELTDREYGALVAEARDISRAAAEKNIVLALECHPGTVTDDYHSALRFLSDVGDGNLRTYWQPNQFKSEEYNRAAARELAPFTAGVHVFNWNGKNKYPLSYAQALWEKYASALLTSPFEPFFLLEFMPGGSLSELRTEVKAMRAIFA